MSKRIKKKIWKCKKCNTRIKRLGGVMESPQMCDICGSKDFE